MEHLVAYCFVECKNGVPIDEDGQKVFDADSLAFVPQIGDHIAFRNNEDGPRGSFTVIGRYIEYGVIGDEMSIEANILIERDET